MMKMILRVFLVLAVAIALSTFPSQAEGEKVPAVVTQCIPQQTRQPITRTVLVGSTRLQGKEYYLLTAYSQDGSSDLIISVTGDRCIEEFFNPMGDPIPLASAVPESVAQQLTLARYQQRLDREGKETLQQQIDRSVASAESPVWFAEEVWALQQLGIAIPDNVQVQP
jgi:hypothetical protein